MSSIPNALKLSTSDVVALLACTIDRLKDIPGAEEEIDLLDTLRELLAERAEKIDALM